MSSGTSCSVVGGGTNVGPFLLTPVGALNLPGFRDQLDQAQLAGSSETPAQPPDLPDQLSGIFVKTASLTGGSKPPAKEDEAPGKNAGNWALPAIDCTGQHLLVQYLHVPGFEFGPQAPSDSLDPAEGSDPAAPRSTLAGNDCNQGSATPSKSETCEAFPAANSFGRSVNSMHPSARLMGAGVSECSPGLPTDGLASTADSQPNPATPTQEATRGFAVEDPSFAQHSSFAPITSLVSDISPKAGKSDLRKIGNPSPAGLPDKPGTETDDKSPAQPLTSSVRTSPFNRRNPVGSGIPAASSAAKEAAYATAARSMPPAISPQACLPHVSPKLSSPPEKLDAFRSRALEGNFSPTPRSRPDLPSTPIAVGPASDASPASNDGQAITGTAGKERVGGSQERQGRLAVAFKVNARAAVPDQRSDEPPKDTPREQQPVARESRPMPDHAAPTTGPSISGSMAVPASVWTISQEPAANPVRTLTEMRSSTHEFATTESILAEPAKPPAVEGLRDISIQLGNENQPKVNVRLAARSGELHVAVRSNDGDVVRGLRQDLPELVNRLTENGYRIDAWQPATSTESLIRSAEQRPIHADAQNGQSQSQSGDSGRGNQQQDQNHSHRPKWIEETFESYSTDLNLKGEFHVNSD